MSLTLDEKDGYELAPCALLTLSANGRIERGNRTACVWTERSLDQLVACRFQDLLTIGSKLFYQTHWWPLIEMQGSVAEVQFELALGDGRALPALVNAVRRKDRRIDVAMFVAADRRKYERELLLARRRAEELLDTLRQREDELRTVAENSPDLIARFDRGRRCIYVNRALESLTGRAAATAIGRHVGELDFDANGIRAFRNGIESAFEGDAVSKAFVLERSSRGTVHLEARFVPERGSSGEVMSVLSVTRDVTALKEQEREAQQRAVLAEQLVGIVSHDLRNPLNAIMLGGQILSSADLGRHAPVVGRIMTSANRATRLIGDLLDFTQARLGGGLRVEPTELDLHAVIAETVDELRLVAPGRAIAHRAIGDGRARADADRLSQIVTNLGGNAIAYGASEQPITITSEVSEATVIISVHNFGRPIAAELAPHIFEPLRRGDEQVLRGSRSVGLGLYIVREIAAAHGGHVTLESTADAGTTFEVALPRRP